MDMLNAPHSRTVTAKIGAWWRVTDAGRHAYELHVFATELKREFGLLGRTLVASNPAMGDPDRRGSMAVRETLEMEAA